jgi:hypothetical protein
MSHAARFPKEHYFVVQYKLFKRVERLKYFGITLTKQNSFQKRLKAN